LRAATAADLPYFEQDASLENDPWNYFGFRTPGHPTREFHENGFLDPAHTQLVVDLDGQLIGDVGWRAISNGPQPQAGQAMNMGCTLLPQYRGHGYGTTAQRLLVEYLFDTFPIHRVEAITDVENLAEQRSLEKVGFTREGVLRGFGWRVGAWRDMVIYSRLRGDA
jgi:RimJ/RimL family protein N-acetyltransferase